MGLSVFMSIILCPPIIFLQFFKEVLKRRASVCGCSSFSLMGNNFQTGYNRHEGFDKVESLGRGKGKPFFRRDPLLPPISFFFHNLKPGFSDLRGGDGACPEEAEPAVFHAFDECGGQASCGNGRLIKDAHDRSDQLFVELIDADDGGIAADGRAAGGDGFAYGLRKRAGYGVGG